MNARPPLAVSAGTAGAVLLHLGGAPWPAAVLAGLALATFALWRTVPGVWAAFALSGGATLLAWPGAGLIASNAPAAANVTARLAATVKWLLALELFGWLTIAAVRQVREPRQLSRRLVGAWLASTSAVLLSFALAPRAEAARGASVLLAGGLLYKLGVLPVYAWAPMLARHPARRIRWLGVAAFAAAGLVLVRVAPVAPDWRSAAHTVVLAGVVTAPWAGWNAFRQWRRDRPCALTFLAVLAVSLVLVAGLGALRLSRG